MSIFARVAIAALCGWMAMMGQVAASEHQGTTPQPAGWGSHGMAVFGGREGLYASHLPMFHAPHDVQVVLRFHVEDAATDQALRESLAATPTLWTLDPESFDLHRFAPDHTVPLRRFNAAIVQGHFERGGVRRFAEQTVLVDEVILFAPLSHEHRDSSAGRYRLIGSGRERFMFKEIDRRPDFDVIVALKPLPHAIAAQSEHLSMPTDGLLPPTAAQWDQLLRKQAGPAFVHGVTVYFETGDLQ